ncbi:zinc-dependent peptidase [Variovorax sp. HJSM1_2]|uniref:M90 family metallopeptidase n=1 Tax=Variovorax sp. HJSM1_2 TaxID=3366263 RepID=UPI003BB9E94B
MGLKQRLIDWGRKLGGSPEVPAIPDALWDGVLVDLPFLTELTEAEQRRLRALTEVFLKQKEFFGANGQDITDAIAVSIAAQACLIVLHMWPLASPPAKAMAVFQDFVTIVLHPGEVLARREWVDDIGVVHRGTEALTGEAAEDGPVTLSWSEVKRAGSAAAEGTNVVIHEFVHKLAMQGPRFEGVLADCPRLPPGFMGSRSAGEAVEIWFSVLQPAFESFRDQVSLAERFGQPRPWLDPYGATSIDEFFPVTCEAYFVNRERFRTAFPTLLNLYDALFRSAVH